MIRWKTLKPGAAEALKVNRNRIVVLVVAAVCVAGLALAAATVSTPSAEDRSGDGTGFGPETPDDSEDGQLTGSKGGGDLPEIFLYAGAVIFTITALTALYFLAKALNVRTVVVVVVAFALILLVGMLVLSAVLDLSAFVGDGRPEVTPTPTPVDGGGGDGNGRVPTESPTQNTDVPIVLLGAFGVVALALVAAIYRFSGTDTDVAVSTPAEEAESETGDVQAVGEAAGRAADKLEGDSETVENAIYRAWREMTAALEVENPRTTTPEEFADVAIDAGMVPDDVRELTWLFEEVRYGDAGVTDEREQRASDALRRIQETYAGGDDDV